MWTSTFKNLKKIIVMLHSIIEDPTVLLGDVYVCTFLCSSILIVIYIFTVIVGGGG